MINLRIKNINHLHKSLEYSILLFISCFAFGRSFKEVATAIMFVTLVLLKINGIKVFPAHRISKAILIYGTVLFFSMLLSSDPVRSFEVLGDTVKAFIDAIDICIQRQVDFVLISGDLFNTSLPSR